jgi:hypothetical protein
VVVETTAKRAARYAKRIRKTGKARFGCCTKCAQRLEIRVIVRRGDEQKPNAPR